MNDISEKIQKVVTSYTPKYSKDMRIKMAHTLLNCGTLELDLSQMMTELAELFRSEVRDIGEEIKLRLSVPSAYDNDVVIDKVIKRYLEGGKLTDSNKQ